MQIFGIGIDITEIDRIEDTIERLGERFLKRVFTEQERAYCDRQAKPAVNYAARFAVKEAVAKAFGTGIGKDLALQDINIVRAESGAPSVEISGDGKAFMQRHHIVEVKVSLSHAERYAAANAIAISAS